MKKNDLIIDRQWGYSNLALWLYLGNFLVFPVFHSTQKGNAILNLLREELPGERPTYFFKRTATGVPGAKKSIK